MNILMTVVNIKVKGWTSIISEYLLEKRFNLSGGTCSQSLQILPERMVCVRTHRSHVGDPRFLTAIEDSPAGIGK